MPDTPFKSMTREKPQYSPFPSIGTYCAIVNEGVKCEKCGGRIYEGSWPWCAGKASDHER